MDAVTQSQLPQRPAVVLLHSSAASARQWDALAARLWPAFDVHAIDLYGHGKQPAWAHHRAMSLRDEAALVLPLLEQTGGAHLVGHSYGGAIAMYIASRHPDLVHSLAVYEPVLFKLLTDHDPHDAAIIEGLAAFERIGAHMAADRLEDAARTFVDYWSGPSSWDRLLPEWRRPVVARMPSVAQQFHIVCQESLPAASLEKLSMRTLCLAGDRTTAAAARVAWLLRRLLPGADHRLLSGMGHMGPLTHAPVVNEQLADFLLTASSTA